MHCVAWLYSIYSNFQEAESFPWDLLHRGSRSIKHIVYFVSTRRVLISSAAAASDYIGFHYKNIFLFVYFQPIAACHQLIYQHDPVHFLEQSLPPALCQDDQTNGLLRGVSMPNLGECKLSTKHLYHHLWKNVSRTGQPRQNQFKKGQFLISDHIQL